MSRKLQVKKEFFKNNHRYKKHLMDEMQKIIHEVFDENFKKETKKQDLSNS